MADPTIETHVKKRAVQVQCHKIGKTTKNEFLWSVFLVSKNILEKVAIRMLIVFLQLNALKVTQAVQGEVIEIKKSKNARFFLENFRL